MGSSGTVEVKLSAILKFGAQNMFKESDGTKKLDDLDLDEILARAETHDTVGASKIRDSFYVSS